MYTLIMTFNRYYNLDRLSFFLLPIIKFIVDFILSHYQERDEFDVEGPGTLSFYTSRRHLFRSFYYCLYASESQTSHHGSFLHLEFLRIKENQDLSDCPTSDFNIEFMADYGPGHNEIRYLTLEISKLKRVTHLEAEAYFKDKLVAFLDDPHIEIDSAAYMDKLYEENDLAQTINF